MLAIIIFIIINIALVFLCHGIKKEQLKTCGPKFWTPTTSHPVTKAQAPGPIEIANAVG